MDCSYKSTKLCIRLVLEILLRCTLQSIVLKCCKVTYGLNINFFINCAMMPLYYTIALLYHIENLKYTFERYMACQSSENVNFGQNSAVSIYKACAKSGNLREFRFKYSWKTRKTEQKII